MNDIVERCKRTRMLGIIGLVFLYLGLFLPYLKYEIWGFSYSQSLWNYWEGKVMFILIFADTLFLFKEAIDKNLPALFNSNIGRMVRDCNNPKFSLIPIVAAAIFAIIITAEVGIDGFEFYGIGFYLLWIGVVVSVIYAFVHKEVDMPQGANSQMNYNQPNQPNYSTQNYNQQNYNQPNYNNQNYNQQNYNNQNYNQSMDPNQMSGQNQGAQSGTPWNNGQQ